MRIAVMVLITGCVGAAPTDPDAGAPEADAGGIADAAARADAPGAAPDAAPGVDVLADTPGCFFTPTLAAPPYERVIGAPGVAYRRLRIAYDVTHGGWRTELFDRPVLNHNLSGLRRNVAGTVGRYLLGNAAQIQPAAPGSSRRSLMYGRVDLEPRPPGQGYTGYTSWRTPLAWTPGETYHVEIILDADAHTQRLEVRDDHGAEAVTVGDIPYYEASLSEATFTLQLGGTESDDREVKAVGWRFCDLHVEAEPA